MAYSASFHRLVMIGQLYGDIFNVTLSIVPTSGSLPAVSDALIADVASVVGTWWPKTLSASPGQGLSISSAAKLTSIKLNRIQADGTYQDATAKETVYGSPISGGGMGGLPPQLSLVSTLRGANERARAGLGRMFWPPSSAVDSVGTDGRIGTGTATQHANGVVTLLHALNDSYVTASVSAVAGIASKAGAGAFQPVTSVTVGLVIDTMRSRRNKNREDPVSVSAT